MTSTVSGYHLDTHPPATPVMVSLAGWLGRGVRVLALTYLYLIAWVVVAVLVATLLGNRPMVVSSGSMNPTLKTGDLLLVKEASGAIENGSIVTFRAPQNPATMETHRVVGVADDGSLLTKGDANAKQDSDPVPRSSVIGTSRWMLPMLGTPILWLRSGSYPIFLGWLLATAVLIGGLTASRVSRHRRVPGAVADPAVAGERGSPPTKAIP